MLRHDCGGFYDSGGNYRKDGTSIGRNRYEQNAGFVFAGNRRDDASSGQMDNFINDKI